MITFVATLVTNKGKVGDALAKMISFISNLKCRFESSCGPKLAVKAASLGVAGYSRQLGKDWWYFLPTGELLTWHPPEADGIGYGISAITWYAGSGLHEKLQASGLSSCCLSSKYPPREFFPNVGAQVGLVEVEIDGVRIGWDKTKWNEAAVRESIREAKASGTHGTGQGLPPPKSPAEQSNLQMAGLGIAGLVALLFMRKS